LRSLSRAVHRSIFVVDVAGFGACSRTNLDQVGVREGLYRSLWRAFAESGIDWDGCYREDRGDGAMVLIPAEVPKHRLAASLPGALATALREHNAVSDERVRMRMRAVLHAGEVLFDPHGVAGTAVNVAFRLLNSEALRTALMEASGELAVMASEWFFEEVIRHDRGGASRPDAYRRVLVTNKETTVPGWVRLPESAAPSGRESARADVQVPPGRPVLGPPTGRLVEVRGREDMLAELGEVLAEPDGRFRVLAGLGGAGKTTIALALAERAQRDGRRVWWVSAVEAGSFTAALLAVAVELGAPLSEIEDARAGSRNPSDVLWGRLRGATGWLLVLDNADDLDVLTVTGATAGDGSGWLRRTQAGLVLVTSRITDPQVWGRHGEVLLTGCLNEVEGAQVLMDLAPQAGGLREASALSRRLGGLPLGLRHAGSYLASPFAAERSFDAYRDALPKRVPELLGGGRDIRSTVTTTWEVSLDALAKAGRVQARPLLQVLACLAPSVQIPSTLIDATILGRVCGPAGGRVVRPGLEALRSVGLLDIRSEREGDRPAVVVHPLVADAGRLQLSTLITTTAAVLVESATNAVQYDDPRCWPRWLTLLPHVRTLLTLDSASYDEAGLTTLAHAAVRMCLALTNSGAYRAAQDLADSALAHGARLGAHHEMVLLLRRRRAVAIGYRGRLSAAESELRALVEAQEQVLGADHFDTLHSRCVLGQWIHERGRYVEAADIFRDLLRAWTRVLGPDQPGILSARHNIGRVLASQGQFAAAEAELRQVLEARARRLGPHHPATLTTAYYVARAVSGQGRYTEAEAAYRALLETRLQVLGPEHPDTLYTRHNYACQLGHLGRHAEAETALRELLELQTGVLGPRHPNTLLTRHELARQIGEQGDHATAEKGLRAVLAVRKQVIGPDHRDTLATRLHLARAVIALGRPAEAEADLRDQIAARERVLGREHMHTLRTRNALLRAIAAQGRHLEAETGYRDLCETQTRVLGPRHPDTLTTRHDMALQAAAAEPGRRSEAATALRDVLDARTQVLGPKHPHTRATVHALSELTGNPTTHPAR
jgi:tetratricopeptide (TPR) repeat protein